MDLTPVIVDRIGSLQEHTIEKLMDGNGPEALGQCRGTRDVDEKEETVFLARPVIATEHPIAQGPLADDLTDLQHEDEGGGRAEGEDGRHVLQGSGLQGHMEQASSALEDVDEGDDRPVDESFQSEGGEERSLLDHPPKARPGSEDLERPDGAAQEKP